ERRGAGAPVDRDRGGDLDDRLEDSRTVGEDIDDRGHGGGDLADVVDDVGRKIERARMEEILEVRRALLVRSLQPEDRDVGVFRRRYDFSEGGRLFGRDPLDVDAASAGER